MNPLEHSAKTPSETVAILRHLDGWPVQSHSCKKVQEAIDAAIEMIERLEAAEKEQVLTMKLADRLALALNTSNHERDALRVKIEAAEKSDAESLAMYRKARDERDALRAKIESMGKQEPVKYERRIKRHSDHTWGHWRECYKIDYVKAKAAGGYYPKFSDDLFDYEMRPLYTLPVVAPQLNEIRTALQRALELGQRETWTGARKHRSWKDQREEQQCWNKVWSLLGAQGEKK